MPSLIDMRRRIRSVKNTQQITKAMKMVSAAKLRRAQDRVIAARPYAAMFRQVLADVAAAAAADERLAAHPLLARRPEERILLVLVTADRGLAGAFNSNLIKAAQQFLREHESAETGLYTIGPQGPRLLPQAAGAGSSPSAWASRRPRPTPTPPEIAGEIRTRFAAGRGRRGLPALQRIQERDVAEADRAAGAADRGAAAQPGRLDYIYEQPPEQLLGTLLPRYVEIVLYQAMLESAAAEQAARMTAMEAATSNAGGHDREADAVHEPRAPGQHHQGNHRSGERRGRAGVTGGILMAGARIIGHVIQVAGPAVDIQFPEGHIPLIYTAVRITSEGFTGPEPIDIIVEVAQHIGEGRVRTIALQPTDGLVRGMKAESLGHPVTVPVGPETLGRVINVIGEPVDHMGPARSQEVLPHPPPGARLRGAVHRAARCSRPASR